MRCTGFLIICALLAGCATTGEPTAGSKRWYAARIQEIEHAYEFGEIDKVEYLRLKGEVDRIRMEYSAALQSRLNYQSRAGFGHHYYFGHFHHHHRH